MNAKRIFSHLTLFLALILFAWANTGCKSNQPPRNTTPITDTQAPVIKNLARPTSDPAEKRLQSQIEALQEQVQALTARTENLARFHGSKMSPQWIEKVQAARAEGSRQSDRMRYLEAAKTMLARKLESLRAELKIYDDFTASDPTLPRP